MAKRRGKDTDNADMPKARITKESIKKASRLYKYVAPYKWRFALGMLCLLLTGATAIVFPRMLGLLVDSSSISMEMINKVGLGMLLLFFLQAIFSYFRVVLFVSVTESTLASLRKNAYEQLIRMPMNFFVQRRVGEINSRLSTDITQLQETFTTNIAEFLRQGIIIIGGIIALFLTSTKLALLMLAVVPIVAIVAVFFGRYIRRLSKQVQDKIAESNTIIEETLQGITNVKSFTNELYESIRYGQTINSIKDLAIKGGKWRGAFISFIIFCLFGAIVLLIWFAVKLENQGELTHGEMIQFMMYTVFVGASIGGIAEQYGHIQKAIGATERIMDILDDTTEEIELKKEKVERLSGEIEFENVGFSYPSRPEMEVLNNVSFTASSGKSVAIVGPSGAGKSTITALLQRFYEPTKGSIVIDNKLAKNYTLAQLRGNIAIVPQDVLLFGGSIKENIAYGKANATMEEIIEAAKKANAHDFIESFPEKYETIVGDRGIKLSGGQRQRIAIARAVLKNPAILILDEATSSLDSESERLVQEALEKLMQGRTSIVIAHRLSTIRKADKIVVLDKGEIVEQGKHEELVQIPNGVYRKLSALQFEKNTELI